MKTDLTKAITSELEQSVTEVDVVDGKYMHIQDVDLFEDKMSLEIWFRVVGSSVENFDYKLYDSDGNWIGKQLTKAEKDEIIAAIESYTAPIIEGKSEEEDYLRKHDYF